jgi:hypothetical protein
MRVAKKNKSKYKKSVGPRTAPVERTQSAMATAVKPWWKRWWAIAVAAAGIISAILGAPALVNQFVEGTEKLPATLEKVERWSDVDPRYTGQWTNDREYDVGMPLEGLNLTPKPDAARRTDDGEVSFDLELRKGNLTGEATSAAIREHLPWSHLMVSGGMIGETLRINVWDFKGGDTPVFARLNAIYKRSGEEETLEFTTIDGEYLFPRRFTVWRGPMREPGPNPNWDKAVRDVIQNRAKKK